MLAVVLPWCLRSSTMKSFAFVLLAAWLAAATPMNLQEGLQKPLENLQSYPGFDYDLSERRLVQLDDGQEPVWMTELEKIQVKADGRKFMDMCVLW